LPEELSGRCPEELSGRAVCQSQSGQSGSAKSVGQSQSAHISQSGTGQSGIEQFSREQSRTERCNTKRCRRAAPAIARASHWQALPSVSSDSLAGQFLSAVSRQETTPAIAWATALEIERRRSGTALKPGRGALGRTTRRTAAEDCGAAAAKTAGPAIRSNRRRARGRSIDDLSGR